MTNPFATIMQIISNLAIPLILFCVILLGFLRKVKVYESFLSLIHI